MNEKQKPLYFMLQGTFLTIFGLTIIFLTIFSQAYPLTFLITMFFGICFSGIGLGMLLQGYRLIKKTEMEVKWKDGEKS
ncbi:hypothetical protein DRO19_02720 [Candidatus Bathyarchaeota archaeon]|nr:MAG: hypothetical protein DRO19_02720 [Candidatus Bathyarchaeota archaeon]